MHSTLNRVSIRFAVGIALIFLAGCETPERRSALQRMDKLQAENSELKARSETDTAQTKMDMARQRQEDLRVLEALNKRFDELNQKIDALKNAAPAQKSEVPDAKPDPAVQAELERVRQESQAQMAKLEEELAKAQAQAEAAKLAAAAADKKPDAKKDTFKGNKLPLTKFIDANGKLVDISQYVGKKNVVVTIMKGFYSQGVCIYCTRQTAGLSKNIKQFQDLDTEVLIVYPGKEEQINVFVRSVRDYEKSADPRFQLPFKVLLDVNQDAVRAFGIAGDLAHPTTFIIDKTGTVRYQYIGKTMSDRPSAAELLEEVKKLGDTK